ncbi:MAG: hypothetical protein ABI151_03570 [Chitinophagaceae bacterium]
MENNTDIIVLTSVVIVLFLVFIIATVRELNTVSTGSFEKEEGGPRAEMLRFIGKLFTDDRIDSAKKMTFMNAIKPFMDDLNSEEDIKKE